MGLRLQPSGLSPKESTGSLGISNSYASHFSLPSSAALLALLSSVFSQVPLDLLALTQHFGSSIITSSLLCVMLFLQGRHLSSTKSVITKRFQAKFWGAVRMCLWTGSCCTSQTAVYWGCSSQSSTVSLASLCLDFPQNYVEVM